MKSLIIVFLLSLTFQAHARTLQSLARMSNALLVLADNNKACGSATLSAIEVSQKSQSLHALIDEKTQLLIEKDFKIIATRAATCDQDCSCDIYAYALEKHGKLNKTISDKATKTKMPDREKCLAIFKNVCTDKFLKKL